MDSHYRSIPIVKLKDVPKYAIIVIAASSSPNRTTKAIRYKGFNTFHYYELFASSPDGYFAPLEFMENFQDHYTANKQKFDQILTRLEDKRSKEVFNDLVRFKNELKLETLDTFESNEDMQYFEPFLLPYLENEVFYDIGGYDGHTSSVFMKECPAFEAVHVFEPERKNAERIKLRFKDIKEVHIHQLALSNNEGVINFSSSGSTSKASNDGSQKILMKRLDDLNLSAPTFLKIDIEGAEINALLGAIKTIEAAHPKIAISVYHKSSDFWKIPETILSIRNDYKVYLRHYTEGIYETVMFFIPKK